VHVADWHLQAQIASAFAALVILAVLVFVARYATGTMRRRGG
jgi:hypothetical protein